MWRDLFDDIFERPVALIPEKLRWAKSRLDTGLIAHKQVEPPVGVEIRPGHHVRRVLLPKPGRERDFDMEWTLLERLDYPTAKAIAAEAEAKGAKARDATRELDKSLD